MNKFISSKSAKVAAGVVGIIAGFAMIATTASAYTFSTNLKVGSTGVDVLNLQKVLNMSADTKVDGTGAGSAGKETSYFGPATKSAVIRFQEKYASDILAPVGLTSGTGFVGASTRAHLNAVTPSTTGMVTGCTSLVGFSPTTGQSCATGAVTTSIPAGCTSTVGFSSTTGASCSTGTVVVTTTGPISVSLANDNPAASAVVATQATADLAHFAFSGNGTITNVKLLRTGISSNLALTNVYLYQGNTRVADAASVNNTDSTITFNGLSIAVNGSLTLSVKADIGNYPGQIVGVQLIGYTVSGSTAMTTASISGNYMNIASAGTMTAVTVGTNTVTGTPTVDAGTTGYTFWSAPVTVTNRTGLLKGANFKFVGSAPADALANIRLYVNGSAVGTAGTINASTGLISFDFGSTPTTLNTGASTIDVRADVVKGSFRTVTVSLANAGDLIIGDSQLGVNVAATNNSGAGTSVTINKGSVTTTVDSSYNATTIAGGSTGATVGQFTMKAYGENVKVDTLKVTFATTSPVTTLNNVAVYVNGSQVGSSANFLGTAALTYTLGSSFIIPANTTVTVKVTADLVDANSAAYTSGTVATVIGGVTGNAQGVSSSETISVAGSAVTGNTLTIGSGVGTFVRTSGFVTATTSPNTNNVKIGSFTLQAGSSEGIKVNSIGVNPAVGGYNGGTANAITNYTNLTVKTASGTTLGTPVGNPAAATSTFSFSEIAIPVSGSQTFDVFADIGAAASSTANPTVTAAMSVSYRGVISNTTTVSSAAGVAIASASASLSASTLVSSSPVAQYVVGGSTMGIATFKLKTASIGTSAVVNKLSFTTTGADAITSITVGGITSSVIGSGAGATTTVSGLNIAVPYTGVDVPVTVKFSGFLGSTTGGSLSSGIASVKITLGAIEGTSGTGSVITNTTPVDSNTMKLYASKPTVTGTTFSSSGLSQNLQKIGEFTVLADTNGKISVATTSIMMSTSTTGTMNVTNVKFSDDGGTTAIATSNTVAAPISGTAFAIGFTTPYEISAGQSKTFSIYATVTGAYSSANSSISTQLNSDVSTFLWNDTTTGAALSGTGLQDFKVGSYMLKNY